ncbi:MAG: thiamine pyrophosphate-dependent dehydrogenase E1 component subunit alpha, partial [Aggregatilineales bacterium]
MITDLTGLTPELLREMYRRMVLVREFELRAIAERRIGLIPGFIHASIGQEASAVGVGMAMRPEDVFTSTHRGHGHLISKGGDVARMMAELAARATGYCGGRGGSLHIADFALGSLGANGIVAGGIPMAVGAALAFAMRGEERVAVSFFGDGAANEGAFHESLNMASIWGLPIVFLCENNQYAMSMPVEKAFNIENISQRAAAYGLPGITVDGNDVLAVYSAVSEAAARARRGEGATLVEAKTYRYKGHSKSDKQAY